MLHRTWAAPRGLLILACAFIAACSAQRNPLDFVPFPGQQRGIIGGSEVTVSDLIARSVVGIVDVDRKTLICTGTLIAPQIVLTAAHCTKQDPTKLAILFSRTIPRTSEEGRSAIMRPVLAGRVPGAWPKLRRDQASDWSDVAVLRFDGFAPTPYAPLPTLEGRNDLKDGDDVTLAGFGLIDGHARTPTRGLRSVDVRVLLNKYSETEILFDQQNGRGACNGDSGGPALLLRKGRYVVAGITSRGIMDPTNTCDKYSLYTSTAAHAKFLSGAIHDLSKTGVPSETIPQPNIPL